MIIHTSRFGAVEVQTEDIIQFPEGVLGFSDREHFVLLEDPSDELFAWLQSCDDPSVAFPTLEPELFSESYSVQLSKSDLEILRMLNMERARILCIVTIPSDPTQMTANMKAPIVINVPLRLGRQCVLKENGLAIREPIFSRLQHRYAHRPQDLGTSRPTLSEDPVWGLAVRLPNMDLI